MKPTTKKIILRLAVALIMIFLLISPTFASISVQGELTHDFIVQTGTVIKGKVTLKNNGKEDILVDMYVRDYFFTAEGKSYYMNPGEVKRSNASWLELERSRLNMVPNSSTTMNYTITVPEDKSLEGTYWSILMVEPISKDFELERVKGKINVGIHESVRFGIQMITTIAETGSKEVDFAKAELSSDPHGNLWLNVDMKNKGNIWVRPDVWIDVYHENGTSVGRFNGMKMRMFPETSIRQKINLGRLRSGNYMALVVADSDDDYIVGAEYKLTIE